MPKARSLVRASDIGQWAWCRRAWWLAHVKDAPHERPDRLAHGNRVHAAHGAGVIRAARYARWGMLIAGLGLLGLVVAVSIYLWG